MYIGKVLGRVVSTAKDPLLEGLKFILVTKIDSDGNHIGKPFVACDYSGAGYGETVFLCGGMEAAYPFAQMPPSDATILGIIDSIESEKDLEQRR